MLERPQQVGGGGRAERRGGTNQWPGPGWLLECVLGHAHLHQPLLQAGDFGADRRRGGRMPVLNAAMAQAPRKQAKPLPLQAKNKQPAADVAATAAKSTSEALHSASSSSSSSSFWVGWWGRGGVTAHCFTCSLLSGFLPIVFLPLPGCVALVRFFLVFFGLKLRWCQDNRNRSNQESKFDFLATRQQLGKIDKGQQKIKIVRSNRQSNLRGSCQSIFSLCWHHPSLKHKTNTLFQKNRFKLV